MAEQHSVISRIKNNGWQQGSFFIVSSSDRLIDKSGVALKEGTQYLLISQNCDIVRDLSKEPYFEFLLVISIEKANGNFTEGKNPRILHLKNGKKCLEFIAYERIYIAKKYFSDIKPSQIGLIKENNLVILNSWLTKRNSRVAYPDEFNRRLREKNVNEKIDKVMKTKGINVAGTYVKLSSFEELPLYDHYSLTILFLIRPHHYKSPDKMRDIDDCFEEVISLIGKINGIKLVAEESKVRSTDDITVHALQQYDKWDMDYLSYSEDGGEVMSSAHQI